MCEKLSPEGDSPDRWSRLTDKLESVEKALTARESELAEAQRRVAELEANGANVEWSLQSLVWSCPPETPVGEFKRHVDWLRGILLPPARITHIPGKEDRDGEMH